MPKLYLAFLLLIFCCSLFLSSCKTNPSKKPKKTIPHPFLVQDELQDSLSPAGFIELQISSSGSTIYGFEYTANGKKLHPTVVFLHGMPGNERNLDLAQNLRRGGYNVIYFDYRGNWGSEGKYSFSNGIGDVEAVLNYITDSANYDRLKIDTNRIAFFGHNLGAGIGFINGINNKRVKAVAGISLFNPYTVVRGPGAAGNLLGMKEYISTLGMLETDANTYLKDLLANVEDYNIEQLIAGTEKPVLVIDEHDNNNYLAGYKSKKNLTYKKWDTDLAFTNRRIALSIELKGWLDKNLK